MPKPTSRSNLTELQKALQTVRSSSRRTNQELASSAGVSTRTLQQVIKGLFGKQAHPSPKMLRGYAESLTRLSLFCELVPEKVLAEYGVELVPDVRAAMDRVRKGSAPQGALLDPSLDRIFSRGDEVRAGILLWEPFAQILDAVGSGERGPIRRQQELSSFAEGSWAWRYYLRQLLGTVNPLWQHKTRGIETITDAIEAVLTRTKDECELVFGIYDTAYRRTRGLAFVPLPGLGVPLGLVYAGQTIAESARAEMNWDRLLNGEEHFKAMALREEAGHLFLAGVCDFREGPGTTGKELITIDEGHTVALAFYFLRDLVESRAIGDSRQRVFVADMPTCRRLFSETRQVEKLLAQHEIRDAPTLREYQKAADAVQLLPPKLQDPAPVYPIGIAVRADSPRWEQLLRTATQELFRNSTSLVARSYARLLRNGASMLRPLPLESDIIPRYYANEFTNKVFSELGTDTEGLLNWKQIWLPNVVNTEGT